MRIFKICLIFLLLEGCIHEDSLTKTKSLPADLANPLIDTYSRPRFDYFAAATIPFGMVALRPDTRYTFPETDEVNILFDLRASLGVTKMSFAYASKSGINELEGYLIMNPTKRRKKPFIVQFVAKFSKPFDDFAGWKKTG